MYLGLGLPIVGGVSPSWWANSSNLIDGVEPGFFANSLTDSYMVNDLPCAASDIYSLTSAAGKTYINQSGSMIVAGANALRRDFTNGVGELLLEGAATNNVIRSNDLFGGGWSVLNATRTTGATFIDGTSNYCEIASSAGASINPRVQQTITLAITTLISLSAYIRAGTAPRFCLGIHNGSGGALQGAKFELSGAGNVNLTSASTTASITLLPNGDFLVQTSFTTGIANPVVYVGPDDALGVTIFPTTSTAGLTVNACGIQAEAGTVATSLIPTAGGTVTRAADTCALTASAYNVLSGTSGAVAARGLYPVTAIASARLVAYGGFQIVGPRAGSNTQAENFNGTTAVYASAGSGNWLTGFGAVGSWNAGNRSIVLNSGTVTNDANGRGSQTSISIGPSTGMQAGQIIRLRQLVGWNLPTIGTNAQLQAQARLAL